MQLQNAVIIITGASSGIGAETARELAQHGARLTLAARRTDQLTALAKEIDPGGERVLTVATDVSRREDIDRMVQATLDRFGRVDGLINNAGIGGGVGIEKADDARLEQTVTINLLAVARCAQVVIPQMKKRSQGVIVNVGSVMGEIAFPGMYAATKFAVRGLSDGLRRELRNDGIEVVLIEPGFVRTEMTQGLKFPMPGAEIVAKAIVRAIQHPRRRIISPWYYIFPVWLANAIPWGVDRVVGGKRVRRAYEER